MVTPTSAATPPTRVAIVGLGDIGTALGPALTAAGHPVVLVSRRTRDELADTDLADLLTHPDVSVVGPAGAAAHADLILLAVPYHAAHATLTDLGDLTEKIVIDATNYNRERDGDRFDPGPGGTTTVLRREFPSATWGKAFNMLWAGWLRTDADIAAPYRVVFVAADDPAAKTVIAELVRRTGFVPFDTGTLDEAVGRQLQGTPAWNQRLTVDQAHAIMPDAPGPIRARS